ncbi:MAG: ANTAR domain-containing protein [Actinomycetota bacterium]|nr:ANTAR domain-containing protein [Actinomycetota bacterium]
MSDGSGPLRVLVADEDEGALAGLAAVLERLGHEVAPFAVSVREAVERIAADDPDLAVVMVHRDDEHALALIGEAAEYASGPVIALLSGEDLGFVARAAERGISACVNSLEPAALQAAIEVAMRRYGEMAALSEKVGQLEGALERRGTIERAKGILMERHGIGEREAFEALRGHARSQSRRVVDVAQAISDGHPLLPRG